MKKFKAYVLLENEYPIDCSLDFGEDHGISKSYLLDEASDFRQQTPEYSFKVRRADAEDYIEAVHERIMADKGKELIDWLIEDLQGMGVSVEEVLEDELRKHIAKPATRKK